MPVQETAVYRGAARSVEERVADLLARMTLEEKVAQIGGCWSRDLIEGSAFSPEKADERIRHGIGEITRVGGATALHPEESAALLNAVQKYLVEGTRLGIPAIIHEESCAGYMARDATCFPQAIGCAATWDPESVQQMADVIRQQMLAVGARHTLAPVLDVARDPRWGRVEETFGEDPYLISAIGTAYVKGLQGADLQRGVAATGKHFVGYGFSEGGMNWAPARIPARELREVFARPFEAVIHEAGLATVMNAYHEMDGVPCGSSREILVDLLRGELGFTGAIVSDYFTLENLVTYHQVAADYGEAARLGLEATLDLELPGNNCYGEPLLAAAKAGQVDVALIDAAVANVLRLKFRLGLFENPYVDPAGAAAVFDTPDQRALAREIARKSIVLLKNEGDLLPLNRNSLRSIAVIGPGADSIRMLQGDYHYPSHLEVMATQSQADSAVPSPEAVLPFAADGQASARDYFVPMVTVLEGIKAGLPADVTVRYAPGCDITGESQEGFAEAVAIARQSEVAVVVVGDRCGLTPICTSGEAVDRADLGLPGIQQALVEAIQATGTPVVLVLINGRPLALPWAAAHIPAIVEAWVPAEEGGAAVAEVLLGDYNPGGRLPVSLPRAVGQVPVYYNHKPSGGRSHWYGDYRDCSTSPLYPFGHGLSYTTFGYENLSVTPAQAGAGETVTISAEVTNTGARAGDEVVQLYVRDVLSSMTRPVKELKGFQRLTLQPGEKKTVSFALSASQLAFLDCNMAWIVEPGTIEIMIGSSSEAIRLSGSLEIIGPKTVVTGPKVYLTPVTVR